MMTIIGYIGYIFLALVVIAIFILVVVGLKCTFWFNYRTCKYCHYTMKYRGLKEDNNNGHYLFHCEHCGAWEEVPKEEFIRECGTDCNPNVL